MIPLINTSKSSTQQRWNSKTKPPLTIEQFFSWLKHNPVLKWITINISRICKVTCNHQEFINSNKLFPRTIKQAANLKLSQQLLSFGRDNYLLSQKPWTLDHHLGYWMCIFTLIVIATITIVIIVKLGYSILFRYFWKWQSKRRKKVNPVTQNVILYRMHTNTITIYITQLYTQAKMAH